jgi:hypothetical protein
MGRRGASPALYEFPDVDPAREGAALEVINYLGIGSRLLLLRKLGIHKELEGLLAGRPRVRD